MDAQQQREQRIRFHKAQRAELRLLLRRVEQDGDAARQQVLAEKIAWIDRQLRHLSAADDRKAA